MTYKRGDIPLGEFSPIREMSVDENMETPRRPVRQRKPRKLVEYTDPDPEEERKESEESIHDKKQVFWNYVYTVKHKQFVQCLFLLFAKSSSFAQFKFTDSVQ